MEKIKDSRHKILAAFLLNLVFALFEFVGGMFTRSVAILSDALHDLGDAVSIGVSYFLEKTSRKKPDETYTYGYLRFSLFGSALTSGILLAGSVFVILQSVHRILNPVEIDYTGMLLMAIIGVIVNFAAAWFTSGGHSLNQKAVNLHMLEDVLGWAVILVGAVIMKFTDISLLDPILSIGVAVFILIGSLRNLKETLEILLEKVPDGLSVAEIREHLLEIEGVEDVHHIHIWSMDGSCHCATLHASVSGEPAEIRRQIREELKEHGIGHVTLELEAPGEVCGEESCGIEPAEDSGEHHHHHRHHH